MKCSSSEAGGQEAVAKKANSARSRRIVRRDGGSFLAATVLRFQPMERAQAEREAALHAPQSGEARVGERAGLWAWSSFRWYACAEAGVVKVNDWPTTVKHVGASSAFAHPSKTAKGGPPTFG